ncbi:MAG: hypothetical protein ACE5FI_18685, partial [Anaerolineales bacterium]
MAEPSNIRRREYWPSAVSDRDALRAQLLLRRMLRDDRLQRSLHRAARRYYHRSAGLVKDRPAPHRFGLTGRGRAPRGEQLKHASNWLRQQGARH